MTQIDSTPVLKFSESWVYKVTVLADMAARKVTAIVQEVSGLNLSQWRVMAALADQPGRTASEVVDVTPMDKGIVSRAVKTLVDRDLVERRASKDDGRLSFLFLTSEGKALYAKIVTVMDKQGASGRSSITLESQDRLIEALNAVIEQYA